MNRRTGQPAGRGPRRRWVLRCRDLLSREVAVTVHELRRVLADAAAQALDDRGAW